MTTNRSHGTEELSGDLSAREGDPEGSDAQGDTKPPSAGSEALVPSPGRAIIAPPERDGALIHPNSGQMIDPRTAEPAELADYVLAIRDWEARARTAKSMVSHELLRRMDADAEWTIREGGFKMTGASPEQYVWDPDKLREVLKELLSEGKITAAAANAAMKREVTYKPVVGGIKKLLKLGGEVKAAIEECRSLKDPEARTVSVSPETP